MNINDNGVRNKSVEANDLANVMSLLEPIKILLQQLAL